MDPATRYASVLPKGKIKNYLIYNKSALEIVTVQNNGTSKI